MCVCLTWYVFAPDTITPVHYQLRNKILWSEGKLIEMEIRPEWSQWLTRPSTEGYNQSLPDKAIYKALADRVLPLTRTLFR